MIRGGPRATLEGKYSPLWASSLGHPNLAEGSPLVYSMWLFSTKILFVLVINLKLRKGYKKSQKFVRTTHTSIKIKRTVSHYQYGWKIDYTFFKEIIRHYIWPYLLEGFLTLLINLIGHRDKYLNVTILYFFIYGKSV